MKKHFLLFLFPLFLLPSCKQKIVWKHYNELLPGQIRDTNFGTREYWQSGKDIVFKMPSTGEIIEAAMDKEIASTFSENDPRKILSRLSKTVMYAVETKTYCYLEAEGLQGYKLQKTDDLTVTKSTDYVVLVKDNFSPAVYAEVLIADGFVQDGDSFIDCCWSYDEDKTGYYVVTNDIGFVKPKNFKSTPNKSEFHFLGTLDGRNHYINVVETDNYGFGIFGNGLDSKTINDITYSPSILNLCIKGVMGNNLIFGDSLSHTNLFNVQIYQGLGDSFSKTAGLLAKDFGSNNVFTRCTFDLGDSQTNPCLFLTISGNGGSFTNTTIKYLSNNSRLVKSDENSGITSVISGLNWKSIGVLSIDLMSGKKINVIGDDPFEYLALVDDPNTKNNEIAEFLYPRQNNSGNTAKPVVISFTASSEATYPLKLMVARDDKMLNVIKEITITDKSLKKFDIYNLYPGTYYYQISDSASTPHKSMIDSFALASTLRPIYNGGNISNMRDIGGWMTSSGKSINYGLIYRSATWENLSLRGGEILTDELDIKTEVDLRFTSTSADYSNRQHNITSIKFIQNGLTDAYQYMLTDANTILNVTKLFNEILTNRDNYPLCYHCSAGADRTGYCSLLIEGALGVSDEDIYRDYELTTFYYTNRVRADILIDKDDNYYFREDGGRSDFWNQNGFMQLLMTNLKPYYTSNGTISDAIVNFLKTKCNVTDESINILKDIMLNK